MRLSSLSVPGLVQIGVRDICCLALVVGFVPLTANESFLSKPPEEWTETEALQVLNDSPWAHTITTTTQDSQCDYENPVFPELFKPEFAREMDSITPTPTPTVVKPDSAEYLVRLVSVKPVQSAAERLINLDPKWAAYRRGVVLDSKPSSPSEGWYNPGDEIGVAIVLKHPGPGGVSFLDYAFDGKEKFPKGVVHLWACAAIRAASGQAHAVISGLCWGKDHKVSGIYLFFPSLSYGRPLISHPNEKLEFRLILHQRVFETTFYVNSADLLDGKETVLRIPGRIDEPTPATDP